MQNFQGIVFIWTKAYSETIAQYDLEPINVSCKLKVET